MILRSEQDAEEGDVIAWWSESERALRGAYGPNLHSALASNDGRALAAKLHTSFPAQLSPSPKPKGSERSRVSGQLMHSLSS